MVSGRHVRAAGSTLPMLGLVGALGASTLLAAVPGERLPAPTGPVLLAPAADRAPVEPEVRQVRVRGTSPDGLDEPGAKADREGQDIAALSDAEEVEGYAVAGATWEDGTAPDGLTVEMRSRVEGVWSEWEKVEVHEEHGPDPSSPEGRGARDGSDAVVLGEVDDVQTRVTSHDGTAPEGLRVALVDPEQVSADAPTAPAEIEPEGGTGTAEGDLSTMASVAGPTPRPGIFTRRQWGADERLRDGSPRYYEVHAGFVHHTVNANSYTRAQVPSILRGIYAYHTQGRGWSDIGYNFLVDRFGRIWEGRYGGVARPVVGAHTLGYNDYSFAMSAIGNFETARPSAEMLNAYGRLMAWKLSLHGVLPKTNRQVGSRTFAAISGHRDAGSTACPGRYLYAQLGTIRNKADRYQASYSSRNVPHNLSGNAHPDLLVRNKTTKVLRVKTGDGGPRVGKRIESALALPNADLLTASPDLTGDGRPDLVSRDSVTNRTRIFAGTSAGKFGKAVATSSRFAGADMITAVGDWNGDKRNDVVTRLAASGNLYFYPGNGRAGFGTARLMRADLTVLRWMVGGGDMNADGRRDLVVMGPAGGVRIYAGNGASGFKGERVIARGWKGTDLVAGGVNLGLSGRTDLVARDRSTGRVWLYAMNRSGTILGRTGSWSGFTDLDRLAGVPDMTGDGRSDLAARRRDGRIVVLPGNRGQWFAASTSTGQTRGDANLAISAGDLGGDGRGDALVRSRSSGALQLYLGQAAGRLTPSKSWTGWRGMRHISGPGDVTGDGLADVMAQDGDGRMWIYPGNGRSGLRARYIAKADMIAANLVVPAGRWNGDGAPDLIVRSAASGDLYLYPGNGPGGLTPPKRIGRGYHGYDRIMGLGDVNRDGRPDLVARSARTGLLWLLPGTRTGLGARQYLTGSMKALDLMS